LRRLSTPHPSAIPNTLPSAKIHSGLQEKKDKKAPTEKLTDDEDEDEDEKDEL
jgi:hypothetical protein